MKTFCSLFQLLVTAAALAPGYINSDAQKVIPPHKSNLMYVTIAMEKVQVPQGESPKVFLTIKALVRATLKALGQRVSASLTDIRQWNTGPLSPVMKVGSRWSRETGCE